MAVERNPNGTIKPGSVLNPNGGRFTYRKKAEEQFEKLLMQASRDPHMSASEKILAVVLKNAEAEEPWAIEMVLKRILPAIERHEHSVDDSVEVSALLARLAGLATTRRTNGHDREADPSGTPHTNGSGV